MAEEIESGVDAEHLEQMFRSRGYRFVRDRIEQIIHDTRNALEQPLDEVKTAELRGFLRGVRRCAGLPAELRAEFLARGRESGR